MLIKEVEPIKEFGINLIGKKNPDEIIDQIVELPLRKACKIFHQKGIETVMSSANKNNVLKLGEKRKEKEDVKRGWLFLDSPTFEDAGRGYAWIMLNFETLSDENKDLLFALEERKDVEGNPIGEKGIWFLHPFMMGNLDYQIRSGKVNFEDIKDCLEETEEAIFQKIEKEKRLEKFENKSIILSYDGGRYPLQTVMIRMPIDENTTTQEVEAYFVKFAERLKTQIKEKEFDFEGK